MSEPSREAVTSRPDQDRIIEALTEQVSGLNDDLVVAEKRYGDLLAGLNRVERVGAAEKSVTSEEQPAVGTASNSVDALSTHLWDLVNTLRRWAASEEEIALKMKETSQKRSNIWGRAAAYQDAANHLEKVLQGNG